MSKIIRCPHCGSNNVSRTTKGKVTSYAAAFGGGFVEGTIKEVVNSAFFDGAGDFVPKFGSTLASYAPIEYVCDSCDCIFKAYLSPDGDVKDSTVKKPPMPEKIIEEVRENYIKSIKKKRPYTSMIIFAIITIYCYVCMYVGQTNDSDFQIFLSLIFSIAFLIPTIIKWKKVSSLNHEILDCEAQTAREFKQSHRDLFSQYTQYN